MTNAIYEIGKIELNEQNKEWFNRRGYRITGETLKQTVEEINGYPTTTEYVIFKGEWTRSGTVRDCGDHYIIARHSRYDRIDKETLKVTVDVEDE